MTIGETPTVEISVTRPTGPVDPWDAIEQAAAPVTYIARCVPVVFAQNSTTSDAEGPGWELRKWVMYLTDPLDVQVSDTVTRLSDGATFRVRGVHDRSAAGMSVGHVRVDVERLET